MLLKTLMAATTITIAATTATGMARADLDDQYCVGDLCFGSEDDGYGPSGTFRLYDPSIRNDFNYRAINCRQAEEAVRWNGFSKIRAIDCNLPTFRFTGWRNGDKYTIRVNGRGAITRVTRK
ncbi:MAG: hypothetical protein ACKOED_14180 [Aestuariivirga sp.]|uniref:hypothetical protein n=1 Tax=Aestuariivirga sp. TaxID=2650926 RepID=UPI0038D11BF6